MHDLLLKSRRRVRRMLRPIQSRTVTLCKSDNFEIVPTWSHILLYLLYICRNVDPCRPVCPTTHFEVLHVSYTVDHVLRHFAEWVAREILLSTLLDLGAFRIDESTFGLLCVYGLLVQLWSAPRQVSPTCWIGRWMLPLQS